MPVKDFLDDADADAERIYLSCREAVSAKAFTPPGGEMGTPVDLTLSGNPRTQAEHFTGWVYAAIRCISQRIAGQPIQVGQLKGKPRSPSVSKSLIENVKTFDSHPVLDLLSDPNDAMMWSHVCTSWVANLELTGRGCLWFKLNGERDELWPIPTHWLTPIHLKNRPFAAWKIRPDHDANGETVDGASVANAYYVHPADPFGCMSPLQAAALPVTADQHIQTAQVKAFENGIHPTVALVVGEAGGSGQLGRPELTKDQEQRIIRAIKRRHGGTHAYGEPIILDALIQDIKKISASVAEMDFLQSSELTKSRILQAFGVSPIVLGQVESNSRAASAEADRHFCNNTLNPKIELLSSTLTGWARYLYDDPNLVVWIEPCVPKDNEDLRANVETLARLGAISRNEARALLLGLEPLPDGDKPLVPFNLVPEGGE